MIRNVLDSAIDGILGGGGSRQSAGGLTQSDQDSLARFESIMQRFNLIAERRADIRAENKIQQDTFRAAEQA